jgi:transposase
MPTKKSNSDKKDIAKVLYMAGSSQKEIAERIGVTAATVNSWVNINGWKELRAAKNITRPELINKLLLSINNLLEKSNEKDGVGIDGLGDKLVKLANTLEKLDRKANVVDVIDVFSAFVKWLELQSGHEPTITLDLIKKVNVLQDKYVSSTLTTAP